MKRSVNEQMQKIQKDHRKYRKKVLCFLILAALTFTGVSWGLHKTGITMTEEFSDMAMDDTEEIQEEAVEVSESEDTGEVPQTEDTYETDVEVDFSDSEVEFEEEYPEEIPTDRIETVEQEEAEAVTLPEDESDEDSVMFLSETSEPVDMKKQITKITGAGTKYDPTGKIYSTELGIQFTFDAENVKNTGYSYYYEYPAGVIIPENLLDGSRYDLYDHESKKAGVYHFEKTGDGKYRVVIDLDEEYINESAGDITGHIEFQGQISEDCADENGDIVLGGDDNILTIPKEDITYPDNETKQYDINTKKSGSYSIKDGKLQYTVYVSSIKGTPGEILFEDTITASGMTLGEPIVSVTKETVRKYYNEDGTWRYDGDPSQASGEVEAAGKQYDDGNLKFTLPKIDPAVGGSDNGVTYKEYTRYKIIYTYEVSDLTADQIPTENKAETSSKTDTGLEVKDTADTTVTVTKAKYTLDKSGWFDSANTQVIWTITVNKDNLDIAGYELTDEMLSNLAEGTDIIITPADGYEIKRDENGRIAGISFTAGENEKNNNTYTIKYHTPVETSWDPQQISNKAELKDGEDSVADGSTSVWVSGGSVEKQAGAGQASEDGKILTIPWTVTLTLPGTGMPAGTIIKDTLDQSNGSHYMTKEQVIAWMDNIKWIAGETSTDVGLNDESIAEITFRGSDGNSYSYQEISSDPGTEPNIVFTSYEIKIKQDLTVPDGVDKMQFSYQTTADISNAQVGSTIYKNTFGVNEKNIDASYEHRKGGVTKTDENNNTAATSKVNADGTLIWKVKVRLPEDSASLTITDTLPTGIKLISIGTEGWMWSSDHTAGDDGMISYTEQGYKFEGTYKDGNVTLTTTREDGAKLDSRNDYIVKFICKVDKESLSGYESGKTYTFSNSAEAEDEKGTIGSAGQTQEWTEKKETQDIKVIDKTGKWDNNSRRIKYSVVINPEGKTLIEGQDKLQLKDVFSYLDIAYAGPKENPWDSSQQIRVPVKAWLVPGTVKLCKAEKQEDGTFKNGDQITDAAWTVETTEGAGEWDQDTSKIMADNLPDGTPMILEYEYQVELNLPDGYVIPSALTVNNSVELEGTNYRDYESGSDVKWEEQQTSGGVDRARTYLIYKVSRGNYGELLPGAEFALSEYSAGEWIYKTTYTTDEEGKIKIWWQEKGEDFHYTKNTLYRLTESKAPDGYLLPENPEGKAIYFYFSDLSDTEHVLPDDLPDTAVDLMRSSQISYVENEKNTTEITLDKKWLDKDGKPDAGHDGNIRVDVYRKENTDGEDEGAVYKTVQITSSNDWKMTLSDLPKTGTNESGEKVTYVYYVKEHANPNYDVSYENNGGITSGTITITNKLRENPSYELPETGGTGTIWFTTGGITLMSAALLCGSVLRRRRRVVSNKL